MRRNVRNAIKRSPRDGPPLVVVITAESTETRCFGVVLLQPCWLSPLPSDRRVFPFPGSSEDSIPDTCRSTRRSKRTKPSGPTNEPHTQAVPVASRKEQRRGPRIPRFEGRLLTAAPIFGALGLLFEPRGPASSPALFLFGADSPARYFRGHRPQALTMAAGA